MKKKNVLFICTNNSVRSQMAEGILNTLYGRRYKAFSAGIKPSAVNPYAIEVMKEVGIDISNHRSKSIEEFAGMIFDYVVTVCNDARENCPFFPGKKIIHKGFPDPSDLDGSIEDILSEFRIIRNEIKTWIMQIFG